MKRLFESYLYQEWQKKGNDPADIFEVYMLDKTSV